MCLASDDSYFILRYSAESVAKAQATNQGIDEDGIEAAFEVGWESLDIVTSYVTKPGDAPPSLPLPLPLPPL